MTERTLKDRCDFLIKDFTTEGFKPSSISCPPTEDSRGYLFITDQPITSAQSQEISTELKRILGMKDFSKMEDFV